MQGLHARFAPQGLHGLQAFFVAQGLQGLQAFFAAHGLHGLQAFFAAQGLHGLQAFFFIAQGLQGLQAFFAAQGLHAWAMTMLRLAAQGFAVLAATATSVGAETVTSPPKIAAHNGFRLKWLGIRGVFMLLSIVIEDHGQARDFAWERVTYL